MGSFLPTMRNATLSMVGAGRPHTSFWDSNLSGRQLGPNGGPYAGVAPTLAGANAGYGGAVQSGANQYAAATPVNPYVAAARAATGG